jgi:SAM-dependent methyltransferase
VLENHFDGEAATRYDEFAAPMYAPEVLGPTVDLLAELAGDGAALELAIGTGRVGLALAARGVPVSGIELSPAMVDELLAKDGAAAIDVVLGDMTTTRVEGTFRLAYLVYNTIGNVETQDRQVACFTNAAAHLEPGGHFVVECVVPDLRRLVPGHDAVVFSHARGYVGYDRYDDLPAQHAVSHHFVADGTGVREMTTPFRFVWPSELDLMARLAGMELRHRWADWNRTPFTADSASHVSVWRKA